MLKITPNVRQEMIDLAVKESPIEACGYLAGVDDRVIFTIPMTNVDRSPEHFSFAPQEQFQAVKTARAQGLQLLAVFHSHPASPARMSEEDIRLANDPEMIYIIVSLLEIEPVIRGFKAVSGVITEVPIAISS